MTNDNLFRKLCLIIMTLILIMMISIVISNKKSADRRLFDLDSLGNSISVLDNKIDGLQGQISNDMDNTIQDIKSD